MKKYINLFLLYPELRQRLLRTLGYLCLFRLGIYIVHPTFSLYDIGYLAPRADFLGIIDSELLPQINPMVYSILALSIMPYYMATIISPFLLKAFKRKPFSPQEEIRTTHLLNGVLTLGFAMLQGYSYILGFGYYIGQTLPIFPSWLLFVTGAMLCMWIADKITAQGLMDGRILLLCVELFGGFTEVFAFEIINKITSLGFVIFGFEVIIGFLILLVVVMLTQSYRRIPVRFEQKENDGVGEEPGENGHLLFRLNMVDEYPMALASNLIVFPVLILPFLPIYTIESELTYLIHILSDPTTSLSIVFTFITTVIATYFYVVVIVDPKSYVNFLNNKNATLTELWEEEKPIDFFNRLIGKLVLPLAVTLGFIAAAPGLLGHFLGMNIGLASYLGGLTLFFIVSLVTDFLFRLEQLAPEEFDGTILGRDFGDNDFVWEIEVEVEEED